MKQKMLAQLLFLVSLVCLAYETVLFRLFTFFFGYHFVSLLVALATLGYGASGVLSPYCPRSFKNMASSLFLGALLGSSVAFLFLPLDVYEFFVRPVQWVYLGFLLFVTFLPFFFHGLLQVTAFELFPELFPSFYAVNFAGSALGVLGALLLLSVCNEVHALFVLIVFLGLFVLEGRKRFVVFGLLPLLFFPLRPFLSPYSPSRALFTLPETKLLRVYRNPAEHLEVFATPYQRVGWGLSPLFQGIPPESLTLVHDHTDVSLFPRTVTSHFCEHLLIALPFSVCKPERVVIIEEKEGLAVYTASVLGVSNIDFVTQSPLFAAFLRDYVPSFPAKTHVAFPRKFVAAREFLWDLFVVRIPVGRATVFPGSFSFVEDFLLTVEGVQDLFRALTPEGVGVFSLFLQNPPSVLPKLVLLLREALGEMVVREQLIVVKGLDFALVLVKKVPWNEEEKKAIFQHVRDYSFDIVYGPWGEEEVERIFQTGKRYYQSVCKALEGRKDEFFDLRPSWDSRPYFRNFFSFRNLQGALGEVGKRWLPFGGAGFLAVLAVLSIVGGFSMVFVLLPTFLRKRGFSLPRFRFLLGGVCTGVGFMGIEIPLFTYLGMLIGFPLYSFSFLLSILFVFSGLGSLLVFKAGTRFPKGIFLGHAIFLLACLFGLYLLRGALVRLSPLISLFLVSPFLGVLGCFLGFPFPLLSQSVRRFAPDLFSEVFAWNGFFSVIASLLVHLMLVFWGLWNTFLVALVAYSLFSLLLYPFFSR
ncbi:MAG: hypothetical protein ABDK87_01135 [Atribacterota bacterium]